jgi:aryl-alcohol dehydrogenase-like predicted oxidoreductase
MELRPFGKTDMKVSVLGFGGAEISATRSRLRPLRSVSPWPFPVHSIIVGTTKPGRWRENAGLLAAGSMPAQQYEAIRSRFQEVAEPGWTGQT